MTRTLEFRNPDRYQLSQLRELIRGRKHRPMPPARDGRGSGFVVEDLDLVVRWYGPAYGLDAVGRIRLCEIKHEYGDFTNGQVRTFGMLAKHLNGWDRFDGFYLVRSTDEKHDEFTEYRVNGKPMTCDEFLDWLTQPYSTVEAMFLGS